MEKPKESSPCVKTTQVLMSFTVDPRKLKRSREDYSPNETSDEDESPISEQVEMAQLWEEFKCCVEFLQVSEPVAVNGKPPLHKQDPCCWDENDALECEGASLLCRHCGQAIPEKRGKDTSRSRM